MSYQYFNICHQKALLLNGPKKWEAYTSSGRTFTTGINNTFIGYNSGTGVIGMSNSSTLGANAIVPADNQMILGDNSVNVGIGLSNDNTNGLSYIGPGNKLEINAGQYGANGFEGPPVGGIGYSGLRFRDMTEYCRPVQNEGLGILTVNEDGDVIYVEDIGNYCNETPQRPLRSDFEIPLHDGTNGHDYFFSGQADNRTDLILGGNCASGNLYPHAKFQSLQFTTQTNVATDESFAGLFVNSTRNKFGIGGVGISEQSETFNCGFKGIARQYAGSLNCGVVGTTISYPNYIAKNLNVGVYGYTVRPQPTTTQVHYAVVGDLGVKCPACTTGNNLGAGDFAGYFNGDIFTTAGFYAPSDENLKENILDISNPMDVINTLTPKSYTYKQGDNLSMSLPTGTHYGFTAQNIESVIPDAVKEVLHPARIDSTGTEIFPEISFKGVNTLEVIPFLVGAIKEQQQMIELMQAEIANLSGGGNRQGHPGNSDGEESSENSIDVKLSNAKAIVLNQNVPNPFAEQTTISYFITDDISKAQIFFYDNKGTILKVVDITEKGAGQLNVFAEDLSSGTYKYTLIADGKVIETKTMVKQ